MSARLRRWFKIIAGWGAVCICALSSSAYPSAKFEKSIGIGAGLHQGVEKNYLAPQYAVQLGFAANLVRNKTINFVNRFNLGFLISGANFGGANGAYNGYVGVYEVGFRLNLARDVIQPYVEAGPLLGLYGLMLSSGGDTVSKNQTAAKYGFTIGTGFDWLSTGKRGDGTGFGIGINFFRFYPSPRIFEFANSSLIVTGVSIELRRVFNSK